MAFSNVMLAKPGVTQGMENANALSQEALQNRQTEIQNQYLPYTSAAQANLMNQQAYWTPLQYQMQMLSNPLMWEAAKSNPGLQNALSQMMQNPMKNMGNAPQPIQAQPTGGILGMVANHLFGGQQQQPQNSLNPALGGNQNAMMGGGSSGLASSPDQTNTPTSTPSNQTGSPLLPASTGNAVGGTLTAQYNTGPFKPGDLVYDSQSGKIISNPSSAVVQQAQQGLSGLQRIDPLIRRLAIEQRPEQSGWTSLLSEMETMQNRWGPSSLNSLFPQIEDQYPEIAKQFNLKGLDLPTLKARADSDLAAAPEQLIRIYGLKPGKNTQQELSKIIEPEEGETGDDYTQRLMDKVTELQEEEGAPYKEQLSQGFTVSGGQNTSQTTNTSAPSASSNATNFGTKNKMVQLKDANGSIIGTVPLNRVHEALKQYPELQVMAQ